MGILAPGIASPATLSRVIYAEVDGLVAVEVAQPALKVFVGNADIADIIVVSDRKFFVLGRQVGQTSLIALDQDDQTLLDARIIVEPLKRHRVTVHAGDTQMDYSCGERCVLLTEPPGTDAGTDAGGQPTDPAAAAAAEVAPDGPGGLRGGPSTPESDNGDGSNGGDGRKAATWPGRSR